MSEQFRDLFDLSRMALLYSGIKIQHKIQYRDITLNWIFYITQFWIYFSAYGEINYFLHCIRLGSMEDLMYDAPCVTICFLGTAKLTNIFYHKAVIVELFEKLLDIFPSDVTDVENNLIEESIGTFKKVIRLFNVLCVAVVFAFCFLPIIFMGVSYYFHSSVDFKYPFDVYYNGDWDGLWYRIFIYSQQVIATFIVSLNVYGADTMFYGCCNFIAMHFKLISCGVNNLDMSGGDKAAVRSKLGQLLERHQLVISLVNKMEQLYSYSSLFNFITSSVLICLSGLNITSYRELRSVVAFGAFLFMSLAQILILCFFGDMLAQSSMQVSIAVYNSSWYNADISIKRSLLIILMRSQNPCKLTAAGFSDLNIGAFGTVLKRSWSYFAMLKTMY